MTTVRGDCRHLATDLGIGQRSWMAESFWIASSAELRNGAYDATPHLFWSGCFHQSRLLVSEPKLRLTHRYHLFDQESDLTPGSAQLFDGMGAHEMRDQHHFCGGSAVF